ncbi:MAG: hypothetical protein ACLQEI_05295, partial [Terriglobales bacterium]
GAGLRSRRPPPRQSLISYQLLWSIFTPPLWSAFTPPLTIKTLPEEEQMQRLEDKFVNSLTRSIKENFDANNKISVSLMVASSFVGLSLSCLVLSLLWTAGKYLLHAFPSYHCLGLF